ncbi:MAG: hypothetical protein ACKOET_07135, partial [Verrucomicrobiota bacterium]
GEPLPLLVEAAFELGPAAKAQVWVLASGVTAQVISVPRSKVAGLDGPELMQALAFEAEAISGINAFDSALGARAIGEDGGERQFWITECPGSEVGELRAYFAKKKARFRGLLHPGGLPRPVAAPAGGGWQRLELWPELVVTVSSAGGSSPRFNVLNAPPNRSTWQAEAEAWFNRQGPGMERHCLALDATTLAYGSGVPLALSDPAILQAWLGAWAAELADPAERVPVITPPRQPMPEGQRWAIAAGIAAGVAGICWLHAWTLQRREARLNQELVQLQQPINQMAALRARNDQLTGQLNQKQAEEREMNELRDFWQDTIGKEHRRHASLLLALGTATPREMAITSLTEEPGVLRLNTVSTSPEVTSFVTNMAARLGPLGWRIDPPRRRALNLQEDGGPWVLNYQVRPSVAVPPPAVAQGGADAPLLVPSILPRKPDTNAPPAVQ